MTRAAVVLVTACVAAACAPVRQATVARPATRDLPHGAERAYRAVVGRFDRAAAMDVVDVMQQSWRLPGNPGFNASIDHIRTKLTAAGFSEAPSPGDGARVSVDEYPNSSPGWDYAKGTVTLIGDPLPVLSKERDRVSLAINSFSTPAEGLTARVIDVGAGAAADFAGTDVKGAVVLGDGGLGALWRDAVRNRGAAGVISTQIAGYVRPDDPAKMDEAHRDVLQWGSVPYDKKAKAFGFKASWRAARRLRAALKQNAAAEIKVDIQSSFYSGPVRSLTAEIPGRSRSAGRVVIVAHVQEPGANDNASGCATLYGLARALQEAISRGALPRPERTLTFMWVDEIRGSRQWISAHPNEARGVRYMFSMDMTGEDVSKTGGTFLVEKQADPAAVWPRPSDPHSEWGAGEVKVETLKGSLLNDVHLAIVGKRARDADWVVRTNPYEGGSDHTVFASAGVPSLLNWHFTDRFYHTNQDTIDKVSAREMENVGIAVATSAYFLASADEADALAVVDLLQKAAVDRIALERRQGAELVARATNRASAERVESQVIAAWTRWYIEAVETVAALPATGATLSLIARIEAATRSIR
ncbi:MAG: M28 family peptidase [Acidobacteria bacterium]|nr:M28 family peptidase [Acidobacteriota bacterium]